MVTGDAILGATSAVGLAVLVGGWKLASMLSRIETRQDNQDDKLVSINTVVGNAALLNGKGEALLRDVASMKGDLRQHIVNSDSTHAAMWTAINR